MKKVIIFGATGKLGAYSALYLKERGSDVVAVGRRDSDNGFFDDYGIPYYTVDIEKSETFTELPQDGVNTILHFAAVMPAAMEGYDPMLYVQNSIAGTLNILEYARKVHAKRIIYTQSHADTIHLQGSEELIPADILRSFPKKGDHSIYSISKNTAVDLIEHYYYEFGIKRFILRLPTIYTYTSDPYFYVEGKRKMRAYRLLIEKAIKGEPIEIWGNPKLKKEIVYVKDFCQIVDKAISADTEGGFYNVGRGIGVSLEEQILGIVNVFAGGNGKSKVMYSPDKPDAKSFVHDISKTEKELGYKSEYDYITGLKDFKLEMKLKRFEKLWGDDII